jgi:hypothetical protein
MTKRGDTHVTLTGKNRKEPELTGVRFLEIQPSSIATPAVAGSPPNNGLSGAGFAVRQTGPSTASTAWDAYAAAFEKHYDGVTPVRNKKVNGQFSKLVERLGDEATAVAAFYVGHPSQFYAVKGHSVDFLLADAEKLRMEWKRGRNVPEAKTNAAKGNKPPKTFDDTDYTAGLTGDGHA